MTKTLKKAIAKVRAKVSRPEDLPESRLWSGRHLRWVVPTREAWRAEDGREMVDCCPLGLVKGSPAPAPEEQVPGFSQAEACAFANWWDSKKDPRRAVEAVWGKAKA